MATPGDRNGGQGFRDDVTNIDKGCLILSDDRTFCNAEYLSTIRSIVN